MILLVTHRDALSTHLGIVSQSADTVRDNRSSSCEVPSTPSGQSLGRRIAWEAGAQCPNLGSSQRQRRVLPALILPFCHRRKCVSPMTTFAAELKELTAVLPFKSKVRKKL